MDFDNCYNNKITAISQGLIMLAWTLGAFAMTLMGYVQPEKIAHLSTVLSVISLSCLIFFGAFGSDYHTAETCTCKPARTHLPPPPPPPIEPDPGR